MLEVKNVSYAYKTKKDKTILNNVFQMKNHIIYFIVIAHLAFGIHF